MTELFDAVQLAVLNPATNDSFNPLIIVVCAVAAVLLAVLVLSRGRRR